MSAARDLGTGAELDESLIAAAISIVSTQANDTPNDVTMAAITMARCGLVSVRFSTWLAWMHAVGCFFRRDFS